MRPTRLNPIIVAVIGVVLSLLAAGGITYFMVMPQQQASDAAQARYDAAAPDAAPSAQQKAQLDLVKAKAQVGATKEKWGVIENSLMPAYDVSQRYTAWKQLSNELSYNLGPSLQRYMSRTGIVPLTSVTISAPPASPNLITAAPLVIPIGAGSGGGGGFGGSSGGGGGGSIQVGGSFRRILHHVQLWNNFNRLVLIDNLALHGNSPTMAGSYNGEVIIFPQGDDKLDKAIPTATGGAATGATGYPGMPGNFGGG